jgi:hypothetical protein
MKSSFFFLLLLISVFTTAQNRQLGIIISPDFSHHYTRYEDLSLKINENETAKFGYRAGLNFMFTIKKEKWFLNTGLVYANRGFQSKKINIENTLNEPKIAENQRYRYHFHYTDIPLQVQYYLIEKNTFKGFVAFSAIPSFMFRESMIHIYYKDNNTDRVRNGSFPNRFFNVFTGISGGILYNITDKHTLLVEPHFEYGWISLQNEAFVTRLWSFGLKAGFFICL